MIKFYLGTGREKTRSKMAADIGKMSGEEIVRITDDNLERVEPFLSHG